jgi:hypothetical protein
MHVIEVGPPLLLSDANVSKMWAGGARLDRMRLCLAASVDPLSPVWETLHV